MSICADIASSKFVITSVKIDFKKIPERVSSAVAQFYYGTLFKALSIPSQSKVNCTFYKQSMNILLTAGEYAACTRKILITQATYSTYAMEGLLLKP